MPEESLVSEAHTLYRTQFRRSPIKSCVLDTKTLKNLFILLEEKSQEAIEIELKEIERNFHPSEDDLKKIKNAFSERKKLLMEVFSESGEYRIIGNQSF